MKNHKNHMVQQCHCIECNHSPNGEPIYTLQVYDKNRELIATYPLKTEEIKKVQLEYGFSFVHNMISYQYEKDGTVLFLDEERMRGVSELMSKEEVDLWHDKHPGHRATKQCSKCKKELNDGNYISVKLSLFDEDEGIEIGPFCIQCCGGK